MCWLMISFFPSLDKEETGDEEECDNGNVVLWTISACSGCLSSTGASSCHLSSKSEF